MNWGCALCDFKVINLLVEIHKEEIQMRLIGYLWGVVQATNLGFALAVLAGLPAGLWKC